jgi:hypothetical protein
VGGIHKKVKKFSLGNKLFGDSSQPIGQMFEKQYDATKAAERQASAIANEPAIPLPDEEELARQRRRKSRGGGRASTVLTDDDKLGG